MTSLIHSWFNWPLANNQKIFFLQSRTLSNGQIKTLLDINTFTTRDVTSNIVGRGEGVAGLSAAGSRSNIELTGNGNGNKKGFPRNLKTNNFFLPPSLKWIKSNKTAASNSLATSPVIFGKDVTRYISGLELARVPGTRRNSEHHLRHPRILRFLILTGTRRAHSM